MKTLSDMGFRLEGDEVIFTDKNGNQSRLPITDALEILKRLITLRKEEEALEC